MSEPLHYVLAALAVLVGLAATCACALCYRFVSAQRNLIAVATLYLVAAGEFATAAYLLAHP